MKLSLSNVFDSKIPAALVFNCHINGLGIIRSLGGKGVPVLGLDCNQRAIGLSSKYCQYMQCPDPGENKSDFVNLLVKIGSRFKNRAVLFPTNDTWLIAISEHRTELERCYLFPMSDWSVMGKCLDKELMYEEALRAGIPIPKTAFLNNGSITDNEFLNEMEYPAIIKGAVPWQFEKAFGIRTARVTSVYELEKWIEQNHDILKGDGIKAVVQEVIPGDASNLYTFSAYSNVEADVVAFSIIQKTIQSPPDFGTIISGRIVRVTEVIELSTRMIKGLGFYGLSNTEFKYDTRDGRFKLMEINPRSGKSIYYTTQSGVNQPYLAYCEATGRRITTPSPLEGTYGGEWIVYPDYLIQRIIRRNHENRQVSKKSRKGRIYAVSSMSDPLPLVSLICEYPRIAMRKLVSFLQSQ